MSSKVSVIVAVYKAEEYLSRCLDSLVNQSFEDYEVLLIDDGSPDNSGYICDAYTDQYSFVHVIHKANGGVASARQCGIDHAQGEYTIHVDADDWVEPDMLESLYRKAKEEDADMVICDYFEIKRKERYITQKPTALTPDAVLRDLLTARLHGSTWNKLIKRDCYQAYNLSFPIGMILEDVYVVCDLCMNNIRVAYLNTAFYHYDRSINKESLSLTYNALSIRSRIAFIDFLESRLDPMVYRNELNSLKCSIKKIAWCSRLYDKEDFMNLYKEINNVYTCYQESKSPVSLSVRLCLSGHYMVARIFLILWCLVRDILCKCGFLSVNFYSNNGK